MARRFLLTSSGITNPTLQQALAELLGRPFAEAAVVYIPTAALADPGDHAWLLGAMNRVHALGWREFDVLDLNGLPPHVVADRLRHADVVYVEGGNHYHLARSVTRNGLADVFLQALETRVYVGVSAGSMIFSRHLTTHSAEVIGDVADLHLLDVDTIEPPFGLFDWYVKPHLHSPDFPERDDAWADRITARADFPIWFIDDDTAIRIRGDALDVVSEGSWRRPQADAAGLLPD
jgi:dipeptidase E